MTKREEMLREDYKKALYGGYEMLKRAAELDRIADKIKAETEYNLEDPKWAQALTISAMADEMRSFYKKMFN